MCKGNLKNEPHGLSETKRFKYIRVEKAVNPQKTGLILDFYSKQEKKPCFVNLIVFQLSEKQRLSEYQSDSQCDCGG